MASSNGIEVKSNDSDHFVQDFLDGFLARGFGSLTKSEIDVLCFHLFQKYANLVSRTGHEISLQLKLPEQKVTRLRYEAALRHEKYSEDAYKEKLRALLQTAQFEVDSHHMVFGVEDKFLRLEIQHRLSKRGSFADSSFNAALVRVQIDRFVDLLHELYEAKSIERIEKAINKVRKASDQLTLKLMLRKYLEGLATNAGRKTVDLVAAGITGGISEIPTLLVTLRSLFDKGYKVEDNPNDNLT